MTARPAPRRPLRSRQRRRTRAAAPATARTPVLTTRAAVLTAVLAAIVLAVALPFKVYISQREAISRLAAQTRAQAARVAALRHEQAQWQDPAYIAQQARERLHYVKPGETAYVVLGGPSAPASAGRSATAPAATAPWYTQVWTSLQQADRG